MKTVNLGSQGLHSSLIALGCMGMSEFYTGGTKEESHSTIVKALDLGVTMFDTADMYGPFTNETLLGEALAHRRSHALIATKFGYVRLPNGKRLGLNGHPSYVMKACDASLTRLATDYIDLYYLHRVDPKVPIEETIGAMATLVSAGKVRFLGVSEASPATIRRAHAVFPLSAVQTEYSLLSRDPEAGLFTTLQELQIGFVAYAPLGRGLLTGRYRVPADLPVDDYRRATPRFSADNLPRNLALYGELANIAAIKQASPAQLALAWVRHQIGSFGVTLVGTKRRATLLDDVASTSIDLTPSEICSLNNVFSPGATSGDRYPDMSRVERW